MSLKKETQSILSDCNMKNRSLWHDGSEKPQTGRVFYESTDTEGLTTGVADYNRGIDRFDPDFECYYSGKWEICHIKRWMYEKDLLAL